MRKSLEQLETELHDLRLAYYDQKLRHVKSGDFYRITGVFFRESDMAPCVRYSPIGPFWMSVEFSRSIDEMGFGERFVAHEH